MGCSLCGQAVELANADFCPTHERALRNVTEAYEQWAEAFGGIERTEFLKRLAKLQGTGRNGREIVEFLQQHPEKWK